MLAFMELKKLSYRWNENGLDRLYYLFVPTDFNGKSLQESYEWLSATSEKFRLMMHSVWGDSFKMSMNVSDESLSIRCDELSNYGNLKMDSKIYFDRHNIPSTKIDLDNMNRLHDENGNVPEFYDKIFEFHDKIISADDIVYSVKAEGVLKQIELFRSGGNAASLIELLGS